MFWFPLHLEDMSDSLFKLAVSQQKKITNILYMTSVGKFVKFGEVKIEICIKVTAP